MRFNPALVLVAAILVAPPWGHPEGFVSAAEATPEIVLPSTAPGPGQSFSVRVLNTEGFLGDNLVSNGNFSQGQQAWMWGGNGEIGSGGNMTFPTGDGSGTDPYLRLETRNTTKTGTIYGYQQVSIPANHHFRLTYLAKDFGPAATSIRIILRQRDADGNDVDTRIDHTLSSAWASYTTPWTPPVSTAKYLIIYLRILVNKTADHAVGFDNVAIQTAPVTVWSAPNGEIIRTLDDEAVVAYPTPGRYTVRAWGISAGETAWQTEKAIDVINREPVLSLRIRPSVPTSNQPIIFDAGGSTDPDVNVTLKDSGFLELGKVWHSSAKEVAPQAFEVRADVADEASALRVDVTNTTRQGSVYVYQKLPITSREPVTFSIWARDTGALDQYWFILREKDGAGKEADSNFTFPRTAGFDRPLNLVWNPKLPASQTVDIYIRFLIGVNRTESVRFWNPSLSASLSYSWSIDGGPSTETAVPTFTLNIHAPGNHAVTVRASDRFQGMATKTYPFVVEAPEVKWDLRLPERGGLGIPFHFGLGSTARVGDFEAIPNGDFSRGLEGWTLSDAEVGGSATWAVGLDGARNYLRITSNATKKGTVYAFTTVEPLCGTESCTFAFDVRVISGAPKIAVLLRSVVPAEVAIPPGTAVDQEFKPQVATNWTHIVKGFRAEPQVTKVIVHLRFALEAGQTATVDFANVSMRPRLSPTWTLSGGGTTTTYDVDEGTWTFDRPGSWTVNVNLTDEFGVVAGTTRSIHVLPLRFYHTISGYLGFHLDGAEFSPEDEVGIFFGNGTTLWSMPLPGRASAYSSTALQVRSYPLSNGNAVVLRWLNESAMAEASLYIKDANGTSGWRPLWMMDAADRGTTFRTAVEEMIVGPRTVLLFRFVAEDPAIRSVSVRLRNDDEVVLVEVMQRTADGFELRLELPAWAKAGTYQFDYLVREASGELVLLEASVEREIQPPNSFLPVLSIVAIASVALMVHVFGRWVRARPKPKGGR